MEPKADIQKLVDLVAHLRSDIGCPWDREQTRETLKPMLIEEAYEVLEALDSEDPMELREELGDLLFQILFHAQISFEKREFDLCEVIDQLHEKMVRRHPHVFGETDLKTSADVLRSWEDLKAAEKGVPSTSKPDSKRSILDGIPSQIPAIYRAFQMTAKASRVGFDWEKLEDILAKLQEETNELLEARGSAEAMREEVGDLLFVMVNVARFLGIDPETALEKSNSKFDRRFRYVESQIKGQGRQLKDSTLAEMDSLWNEAKDMEANS